MTNNTVLEVRGLTKHFRAVGEGSLFRPVYNEVVRNVSFCLRRGETFGLVGESGCGKSTVARLIMGLEKPTAGEIFFGARRIDRLPESRRRPLRPRLQMVFQDSGSSLNPRKRVFELLSEPMVYHGIVSRGDAPARVDQLLDMVGLTRDMRGRYPHEFSGGQRQRICIARALSLNPDAVVLDEPVSALDVSVQAQILNLLRDLQQELGLTYLFIGHGLGAVRYMSHRMAVMYMGQIVETGDAQELFDHPAHPYTRALLDAAPVADYALRNRARASLRGEISSAVRTGCPLRERCPYALEECAVIQPGLSPLPGHPEHLSACRRAAD